MDEKPEIVCRRCGACCGVDMIAYVSPEDIQRWEREGRTDIITRLNNNDAIWAGDRIISREGLRVTHCYYLGLEGEMCVCEIYPTRPRVCREYVPGSSELCPLYFEKNTDD